MSKTLDSRTRPTRRRLSRERGSVIFIVIMGMLLLTSLGTWVVYAGGIASNTSGYQRSASQTLYLSELAVLSGAAYLAQPGRARDNYTLAQRAVVDPTVTADPCASVPAGATPKPCKSIFLSEINQEFQNNGTGASLLDMTAGGSLSPYATGLDGDFWIELSGFRSATMMGERVGSNAYREVTITSYATTRPGDGGVAGVCTGAEGLNAASTLASVRAFSVIGPVE